MKIETDTVEILVRRAPRATLGSPVAFLVRNRDHENWRDVMSPDPQPDAARERGGCSSTRGPGHADLAGALKYVTDDLRNVLERASARETTMRVAAAARSRARSCAAAGVEVRSHVVRIGAAALPAGPAAAPGRPSTAIEESPVRCADAAAGAAMVAEIDRAKKDGRHGRRRLRGGGARRCPRASAPSPSGTAGSTAASRRPSCRSTP